MQVSMQVLLDKIYEVSDIREVQPRVYVYTKQ